MTLVVPSGFAQIAFQFGLNSDPQPMVTTLGIEVDGDLDDIAAAWHLRFTTAYPASSISTDWTYRGVIIRTGDGVIYESPVTHAGTAGSGGTVPNNCALLVKKGSARGGRTGRGRMYIPPFGLWDSVVDPNGMMASTTVSGHQGKINTWLQAGNGYLLHSTGAPGGTDPTPITSYVVDPRIATQRRRMRP